MRRVAVWLLVAVLLVGAHAATHDAWRAACLIAALLLFGALAPRALRTAILVLGLVATLLGIGFGTGVLLDALPALIAALVAWLFARTLITGRRPLIARAIAVLDGEEQLDDAQVAGYARRLTWLWAIWQGALAAFGAIVVMRTHGLGPLFPAWLPSPVVYGVLILPLAVIALFLGEYLLRPRLLPQARRHPLWQFFKGLLQAWPRLIGD